MENLRVTTCEEFQKNFNITVQTYHKISPIDLHIPSQCICKNPYYTHDHSPDYLFVVSFEAIKRGSQIKLALAFFVPIIYDFS